MQVVNHETYYTPSTKYFHPVYKSSSSLQKKTEAILCNRTPIQQLQAEVEAYKTSLKLEIDGDETPTRWWKNHSTVYPVLAKLAKQHLFMCATGCTS